MPLSYAGLLVPVAIVDGAGNAQPRIVVDVYNADGTPATVYADSSRSPYAGAVTSDTLGNVTGVYAEAGTYRIRFTVDGSSYETETFAQIDPREITDLHTLITGNTTSGTAEATARAAADSAETAARIAAVAAEAALRASGDSTEASTRAAADNAEIALRASLAATEAADHAADQTAIGNEVTARAAAVTAEQNRAVAAEAANAALISGNTTAIGLRGIVVNHGSVASTARPTSTLPVAWYGTVAPTNAATNDTWDDQLNDLRKRWDGTAWQASGKGTYPSRVAAREQAPTTRTLGALNPLGIKLRGICTTPRISDNGDWSVYWGPTYSHSFVDSQLAAAVQLGCNCVSVYGNLSKVVAATQTMSSYLANLSDYLTLAATYGLWVAYTIEGSVPANITQTALLAQVAALVDTFPNVIHIDIINEFTNGLIGVAPTGTQISQIQAATAAVKAVTNLPVSWSAPGNTPSAGAQTTWQNLLYANSDVINIHPYLPSGTDLTVAQMAAIRALNPGKAVLLGEVGQTPDGPTTNVNLAARFGALRAVVDMPGVAGLIAFASNDYNNTNQWGLFDANWKERKATTWPFRTLPKRATYQGEAMPIVTPSSPVALTTTPTTVPNSQMLVAAASANAGQGDAMFRAAAEFTGLTFGDVVQAQVIDPTLGAVYGAAVTATPPYSASTPDGSAAALPMRFLGGTPTTAASPIAGFGNVITLTSGVYGIIPAQGLDRYGNPDPLPVAAVIGGSNPWTVEPRFIRSRVGVQETILGCWAGGVNGVGAQGVPSWLFYIDSANRLACAVTDASSTLGVAHFLNSGATTITDTNAHSAALTFDGSLLRLFLDGVLVATGTNGWFSTGVHTSFLTPAEGYQPIVVGGQGGPTLTNPFVGSIEDIRISSTCRYTANYTPSAAPATADASTVALYACDTLGGVPVVRVETPWTYVRPGPDTAVLQVANNTGARGSVVSAAKQVRYTG